MVRFGLLTKAMVVLLALSVGFIAGILLEDSFYRNRKIPVAITVNVTVKPAPAPTPTPQPLPTVIVEKVINHDVPYYVYKQPRYFDNVTELQEYVDSQPYIMPNDGILNFDCDDFARFFQQDALRNGYIVNCEIEDMPQGLHMLNSTKIGNEWWFIEPQDHTIWKRCNLD